MNIAILTQPLRNNYGALLQNYALQKVLKDSGHNPITFDWEQESFPVWKRITYPLVLFILRNILGINKYPPYIYQPSKKEAIIISSNTQNFVKKYISRIQIKFTDRILNHFIREHQISAIVVGSDQVWRPRYNSGHLEKMYLSFIKGNSIKRIAYAASFGTEEWEYTKKQTSICKRFVKEFNLITVREYSAINLCAKYLGVSANHVLDPTMLLDKSIYETIVNESKIPNSIGNLFYYILDPSIEKTIFIKNIANKKCLKPFSILPKFQKETLSYKAVHNDIDNCIYQPVEYWLKAFMDAKIVICDSFHGCVFSIIFNKPFWVLSNFTRGNSRFESLLKLFNLQERLINPHDFNSINIDSKIEWEKVNSILKEKSNYSKELLLKSLC